MVRLVIEKGLTPDETVKCSIIIQPMQKIKTDMKLPLIGEQ